MGLCFFGTSLADAVYLSRDRLSKGDVRSLTITHKPPAAGKALTISAIDAPVLRRQDKGVRRWKDLARLT